MLTYLLSDDIYPYKMGLDGNQIYIAYRIHISDIFSDYANEIKQNITRPALEADRLDNYGGYFRMRIFRICQKGRYLTVLRTEIIQRTCPVVLIL